MVGLEGLRDTKCRRRRAALPLFPLFFGSDHTGLYFLFESFDQVYSSLSTLQSVLFLRARLLGEGRLRSHHFAATSSLAPAALDCQEYRQAFLVGWNGLNRPRKGEESKREGVLQKLRGPSVKDGKATSTKCFEAREQIS